MASSPEIEFMRVLKTIGLDRAAELFNLAFAYDTHVVPDSVKQLPKVSHKELIMAEKVGNEYLAIMDAEVVKRRGRPRGPTKNNNSQRVREYVQEALSKVDSVASGAFIQHVQEHLSIESRQLVAQAIYSMKSVDRGNGMLSLKR